MVQTVYVQVTGFTDIERHALNSVFRLSQQRDTVYALWTWEAPEPAKLILADGQSPEAATVETPRAGSAARLFWVGPAAPAGAQRHFDRPINWARVVQAMDDLFAPPPAASSDLDIDLGFDLEDGPDTEPPQPGDAGKRVLIVNADRDERLYLRAKMALAGLLLADEAATGAEALAFMAHQPYALALVDLALPDMDGWQVRQSLADAKPAVPHVILTKHKPSWKDRLRARRSGALACLDKPLSPVKLYWLLRKV